MGFDFEEMAWLAKNDPEAFARRRQELIQRLIGQSEQAASLANLQLDLDAARYCSPPGVRSGGQMVSLMLQTTARLTGHVTHLNDLLGAPQSKAAP